MTSTQLGKSQLKPHLWIFLLALPVVFILSACFGPGIDFLKVAPALSPKPFKILKIASL